MTLKTLATNVGIEGNIRISIWDDMGEEETEVHEFHDVYNFRAMLNRKELYHLRNMQVTYMFTPGDDFLHIELKSKKSNS